MRRIEDYAIIGDLRTAALVSDTGAIDWLCLPRFDSPAAFAALLDDERSGHWTIAPRSGGRCSSRRYLDDTLVLETTWDSPDGQVRVVDFMPRREGHPYLVRMVIGVRGSVPIRSVLRPRFDYGQVAPWLRHRGGRIEAVAGPDCVRLTADVASRCEDWDIVSDLTVTAGDRVPFVFSWRPSHEDGAAELDAERALTETIDYWLDWTGRSRYPAGPYREAVIRSVITLKALTYEPTGGIIAAPTTSLPEEIGGVRNWDYRYCWLRDATYTLQALLAGGCTAEAATWREWLLRAIAGKPEELQIVYSLDGGRRLPETELPWLRGYESSRPVRAGNAASDQLQLDVWGETLDALFLAREAGLPRSDDAWALQVQLMNHLESAWREPDNGLWEVRGDRQHFTHSKVMAWVAADRMARSVRRHGLPGPAEHWEQVRDEIHREVLERAYDPERNTFTQAYGSGLLDASTLLIPRVGFLAPDDPRVMGTIEAIQRELTEDGLVKRYQTGAVADGLPGGEGLFVACSFWLVDALHGAGRRDEAVALFERLLTLRNDVGLLSEEWDPVNRRQLGNTPQAFSHFGLVVSATQLDGGSRARSDRPVF
ncbi:glycoside hydrolase family 15 protein [Actinoplanes sp. NPDC049596]|uniref:glycoside hydrolase family 15 protein n=1 Tax=unclassified Actinoplanes TaxID=2626549 RepID=UPI00343AEFA0